jgi:hypothetical protein
MKFFLCWSGTRSREFAVKVEKWLPQLFGRALNTTISTEIEKGSEWFEELRRALDASDAGILCLTQEAVASPWIHFEAGSLVRALGERSGTGRDSGARRVFLPSRCRSASLKGLCRLPVDIGTRQRGHATFDRSAPAGLSASAPTQ